MTRCIHKFVQVATLLITISASSSSALAGGLAPIQTVDGSCSVYDEWPEPSNYQAIWTGSCVSGKGQGFGSLLMYNAEKNNWEFYFEGQLDEGRMTGEGLYIWPSGLVGSGSFSDGKLSGESIQIVPSEKDDPFVWVGSYNSNSRVAEGAKTYSLDKGKSEFQDRTDAIVSLLSSPQCNVAVSRASLFEMASELASFSNGFPLQGKPLHYYEAFKCLNASGHARDAHAWLDAIFPQYDPAAGSNNTECDLPNRFSSLCSAASDAYSLAEAVGDGYGLARNSDDPMRSNKRLSGALRVSSKTRFPLQRVLNLALNGNSDAMMVLVHSFNDSDWSDYWAEKSLKAGNLSALSYYYDQQSDFFYNLGLKNRNVSSTLRGVNEELVAISVSLLMSKGVINTDYDLHTAWCLMSKWGGENRNIIVPIELPRAIEGYDVHADAINIPTVIEQSEKFGSQCATDRLLKIAQFDSVSDQTKTLSWFLENVDMPSVYSYALSCIYGSATISGRFCDVPTLTEDDALDLVMRSISAQAKLSRKIYQGSGYRLAERAEREALWKIQLSSAHGRGDEKFLRDVYLAAAQDLKDKELFLTAASLSDPYLFPGLSKRDFFGAFEDAANYIFEDQEKYPFVEGYKNGLRVLIGSYFKLYADAQVQSWMVEGGCQEKTFRGDCFSGEILPQVSAAMQGKSQNEFLKFADEAANDFLHYSGRHHGICKDPSKTFLNGRIERLEYFGATFFSCQSTSLSDDQVMTALDGLITSIQDILNFASDDTLDFEKFAQLVPPANIYDMLVDSAFVGYWDTVVKNEWNRIPATKMSVDRKFDCQRPENKQRSFNLNEDSFKHDFTFNEECLALPEMLLGSSRSSLNKAKDFGSIYAYIMLSDVSLNDSYVDRNQLSYRTLLPLTTLFPAKKKRFDHDTRNRSLKWLDAVKRIYSIR